MMRAVRFRFMIAGVVALTAVNAWPGNVKNIANTSVRADQISPGEIKSVFLQERHSLNDGRHVEPVLERNGPAHVAFLKDFIQQNDDGLQRFYLSLVFTGRGSMPKALGSDAEVIAYVARTEGAIGYVDVDTDTDAQGVKTLMVVDETTTPRRLIVRVEPIYPEELKRRSIGGTVRLRITISPHGDVKKVGLVGGNPILGEAAVYAVQQWKYAPALSQTIADVSIPFGPRD